MSSTLASLDLRARPPLKLANVCHTSKRKDKILTFQHDRVQQQFSSCDLVKLSCTVAGLENKLGKVILCSKSCKSCFVKLSCKVVL